MAGATSSTSPKAGATSPKSAPTSPGAAPSSRPIEAEDSTNAGPEILADDGDSAVSVDPPSFASLRSSILEFQVENGRTYHSMSSGKYAYPNDNAELERLNIQHNTWLLTLQGQLCLCPKVEGAKRVLDLGTGNGAWAIDYADCHPEAEVVGVDLSPVQPSAVPSNCYFEVDDLEKEWTWTKPFDFIFSRVMSGSFSDYEEYIRKAYNALEPGGYFEMQDIFVPYGCDDNTMTPQTEIYRVGKLGSEAATALGRPLNISTRFKEFMTNVGFEDVREYYYKWPIGTWPKDKHYKEIGYWCWANLDHGLEGLLMALLTRGLGWTPEEVYVLCARARAELETNRVHAYVPINIVYGRKPGSVSSSSNTGS